MAGPHFSVEDIVSERFWDARYRERDRIWSGEPNRHLVAEAAELTPGHALDLGCGEGGDAIWLASRGWTVDAVDISAVALDRGAEAAARAGVADRVRWLRRDLVTWRPEGPYDLVSAQYVHLPPALRRSVLTASASAVRTGGSLLVVGHAREAHREWDGHDVPDELFAAPEEVTDLLGDPWQWLVETCGLRGTADHTDAVYRATRLPD